MYPTPQVSQQVSMDIDRVELDQTEMTWAKATEVRSQATGHLQRVKFNFHAC